MAEREPDLLLLDTHIWIWVMEGVERELADAAVGRIEQASTAGTVRVAVMSVWEVAMLEAQGRVRLALGIDEWVRRALAAPGTQLLELTPEIAIEATRLPGRLDGDPVDRILVAAARRVGATLVTRDERIIAYGGNGYVRVLDARP